MEEELCRTCKEPYRKVKDNSSRAMFCSSSFHCCRDCKWSWEDEGGFSAGKIIEVCVGCKEYWKIEDTQKE